MDTNEANTVRLAIDKLTYISHELSHQRVAKMTAAKQILEHLLDASQPDTAAHLQARIDAAMTDIADMVRGYGGAADSWWTSKLTRIARILRGEQS